jgi:nucleoside-diphosphate-sugar epimerase
LVDPNTLKVVKTITEDNNGQPLTTPEGTPRLWYDTVYMEDASQGQFYLFANEGDVYEDNGIPYSYVTVIDTVAQKVGQHMLSLIYHLLVVRWSS